MSERKVRVEQSWLPALPMGWGTRRVKDLVSLINGYPFPSELFEAEGGVPLVRIRDIGRNTTETSYLGTPVTSALITSQDVLIGMDGDFTVGRWLGSRPALLNQRVCALRSRDTALLKYIEYALPYPLGIVNQLAYSTTVKHLSSGEVLHTRVPLPDDPRTLKNIVAFLDHETARIDELVREQEQLIQLLSEKRQAAIRHVAAKGMNPHVPMRESGVNWLGKIPAHWGLSPLKYICRFFGGGTPAKENPAYWHGDIPWVTAKDMKSFWVSQSIDTITQEAVLESSAKVVEPGALLIVVRSGILQRTIPVGINTVTTTVNQDMKALTFARAGAAEYIAYLIHGNETALLQAWRKQGATVESIEQEDLASTLVPVPPDEELSQITHELRRVIKQFEDLQLEAQKSIQVLSERRSALISAAVTGQLDLSDWQLPEPEAVAEVA